MGVSSLTVNPASTLEESNDLTIVSLSTSNAVSEDFGQVSVFIIVTAGSLADDTSIGSG